MWTKTLTEGKRAAVSENSSDIGNEADGNSERA